MAPRPISIVVMQQFSKLQRTVQFCYWALSYRGILGNSICVCRQVVRQESAKLLSSVRFWPDTFNPVDFHGINLIPSRQIGKVTSLWTSCLEVRPLPWEPCPSGVMVATYALGAYIVRCGGSSPLLGIGFYIQIYAGIVQWYSILLSKRRDLSSNLSSCALPS